MAYLSQITINPLRARSATLIGNPQRIHAAVLNGLAVQPVEERVLWRLERREHDARLLVLTQSEPSWEALVEAYGWPSSPEGAARVANYEPLLAQVARGREFGFRLVANPSSSVRRIEHPTASQRAHMEEGVEKRGVRVGHRTAGHQLEWFLKRASGASENWGFTVDREVQQRVRIVAREKLSFSKGRGERRVELDTATFEGALTVTDAGRLREVLLAGIGRGKAYGCGLLTIAPPAA